MRVNREPKADSRIKIGFLSRSFGLGEAACSSELPSSFLYALNHLSRNHVTANFRQNIQPRNWLETRPHQQGGVTRTGVSPTRPGFIGANSVGRVTDWLN